MGHANEAKNYSLFICCSAFEITENENPNIPYPTVCLTINDENAYFLMAFVAGLPGDVYISIHIPEWS